MVEMTLDGDITHKIDIMSQNTAITAKDDLKKAIKAGKTECVKVATLIEKIINEALWEYLSVPGESASDKLHNLIVLPYDQGGLNTAINEVDALLQIRASTQLKFRNIVFQAKPGERTDLKPKESKVDVNIPAAKKSKSKGPSKSQQKKDRAVGRAMEAIPEFKDLLDEELVTKGDLFKLGGEIKNLEQPTVKEAETIAAREQVAEKIKDIVPKPLPTDKQARKQIKAKVQKVVEEATGKVTPKRITLGDPQVTAKAIVKVNSDIDYLQQLVVAIELEIEDLQQADKTTASSKGLHVVKAA